MKVVDKIDAGTHYQKSELRNHYNRVIDALQKEEKLFIDDRRARSVAVMISYRLYKKLVVVLEKIEELEDQIDYQTALLRAHDGAKPLSSSEFKKLLKRTNR